MLFGKISPQAVISKTITPFEQTDIVGNYIAAVARPYILGANVVNFEVFFGNPTYDDNNELVYFNVIYQTTVNLSGTAIENWGTDDTTVLSAIATQQGTTITEFENWFPKNFE